MRLGHGEKLEPGSSEIRKFSLGDSPIGCPLIGSRPRPRILSCVIRPFFPSSHLPISRQEGRSGWARAKSRVGGPRTLGSFTMPSCRGSPVRGFALRASGLRSRASDGPRNLKKLHTLVAGGQGTGPFRGGQHPVRRGLKLTRVEFGLEHGIQMSCYRCPDSSSSKPPAYFWHWQTTVRGIRPNHQIITQTRVSVNLVFLFSFCVTPGFCGLGRGERIPNAEAWRAHSWSLAVHGSSQMSRINHQLPPLG